MTSHWQKFSQAFNSRVRRERIILLVAAIAVVYLLWSLALSGPVNKRINSLQTQKEAVNNQWQQLKTEEELYSGTASSDPGAAKKRRINDLRQRLEALDKELQALAVGLVPAEELPQVLHDVLSNTERLELLGMQTLPVEKLAITEDVASTDAVGSSQQVDVYRHAVELKVRGSYFAVANYLRDLEALHWRFYWDKLDYKVEGYPRAVAILEVYTLSAGEGLLGE